MLLKRMSAVEYAMLIDFGVLISTFRIAHLPVPIPLVPHDVPTDLAHAESGAGANDLKRLARYACECTQIGQIWSDR